MRAEVFWPVYICIFFGLLIWGIQSDRKATTQCIAYAMDTTKYTPEQIKELCK